MAKAAPRKWRKDAKADETALFHLIAASKTWRFYAMFITRTLFGETAVIRNWGRIGTRRQMRLAYIHVIASWVNADTGLSVPLSKDHLVLSEWAEAYERRQP